MYVFRHICVYVGVHRCEKVALEHPKLVSQVWSRLMLVLAVPSLEQSTLSGLEPSLQSVSGESYVYSLGVSRQWASVHLSIQLLKGFLMSHKL